MITAKIYPWTSQLHVPNAFELKPICFEVLSLGTQNAPANMMVEDVLEDHPKHGGEFGLETKNPIIRG